MRFINMINKRALQKQERMALFIDCTRRLIEEEGFKELSIRKIADRAGLHNSTIYFYFRDADYLMALASVRSFEKYSKELSVISTIDGSNYDVFYPIWECFCRHTFAQPELFYQFFFGKYKDSITEILNQYYSLFPEEKQEYSQIISEMYYAGNLTDRCLAILKPLSGLEQTRVTDRTLPIINTLSIVAFRDILEKKCTDPSIDNDTLTKEYLSILHFLVDAG